MLTWNHYLCWNLVVYISYLHILLHINYRSIKCYERHHHIYELWCVLFTLREHLMSGLIGWSPEIRSRRRGGGEWGRGSRYTVAVILQWRDIHRHSTMDGTIYLVAWYFQKASQKLILDCWMQTCEVKQGQGRDIKVSGLFHTSVVSRQVSWQVSWPWQLVNLVW